MCCHSTARINSLPIFFFSRCSLYYALTSIQKVINRLRLHDKDSRCSNGDGQTFRLWWTGGAITRPKTQRWLGTQWNWIALNWTLETCWMLLWKEEIKNKRTSVFTFFTLFSETTRLFIVKNLILRKILNFYTFFH